MIQPVQGESFVRGDPLIKLQVEINHDVLVTGNLKKLKVFEDFIYKSYSQQNNIDQNSCILEFSVQCRPPRNVLKHTKQHKSYQLLLQ